MIAKALARRGVRLVLAARSAEGLAEVSRSIEALGVPALPVAADVTDPAARDRLVAEA